MVGLGESGSRITNINHHASIQAFLEAESSIDVNRSPPELILTHKDLIEVTSDHPRKGVKAKDCYKIFPKEAPLFKPWVGISGRE